MCRTVLHNVVCDIGLDLVFCAFDISFFCVGLDQFSHMLLAFVLQILDAWQSPA